MVAPLQVHQRRPAAPVVVVGRVDRAQYLVGVDATRRSTPTTVTRAPKASAKDSLDWRTAECSTAANTTWGRVGVPSGVDGSVARHTAPHVAAAIDSVAPLVNTTSRGRAPTRPATWARACSSPTRAAIPSLWMRPGSAGTSPSNPRPSSTATIASTAGGRNGEVEAWSR